MNLFLDVVEQEYGREHCFSARTNHTTGAWEVLVACMQPQSTYSAFEIPPLSPSVCSLWSSAAISLLTKTSTTLPTGRWLDTRAFLQGHELRMTVRELVVAAVQARVDAVGQPALLCLHGQRLGSSIHIGHGSPCAVLEGASGFGGRGCRGGCTGGCRGRGVHGGLGGLEGQEGVGEGESLRIAIQVPLHIESENTASHQVSSACSPRTPPYDMPTSSAK